MLRRVVGRRKGVSGGLTNGVDSLECFAMFFVCFGVFVAFADRCVVECSRLLMFLVLFL